LMIFKLFKRFFQKKTSDDKPPPPKSTVTINGNTLLQLLRPYGITLSGGPGDYLYKLMSPDEARRFLRWYKANAPIKPSDYEDDDRDCEDFAWIGRAFALLWMESKYVWGYIEAEGADPVYGFPNHGFCFIVTDDYRVWYADPLGIAGPDDDLKPAYVVKCHSAKA